MANKLQEHVMLYVYKNEILNLYNGDILEAYTNTAKCLFSSYNGRFYVCHSKPYFVYNGTLWLPKREDFTALSLFLKHEENEILKLKSKIQKHENNIITMIGKAVQNP